MSTVDLVKAYIHRLCAEIGVEADSIFNQSTGAWYFSQRSSTIEVFLTTQKNPLQEPSVYIRCMSPLCNIPTDITKQFSLYKTALAINASYLGYKITADESRGIVCIVTERNIVGLDYAEMLDLINDLGLWAEKLQLFFNREILGYAN
ncbi:YbjN domain-containing protein [Terrimonas sp. NA20]|uniref:YbjN domain-containing protein n=1 Tax=Terrimonas ginsenosidimutans TaxID=2908004 RepID=A0ABS9KVY7_9BACT|nr:YbjN domain-containing protein [Terrimonas ginsenosidimutans]MCG2616504.1 YbjN domain-containing protein [Terrimonas ginsenosidimutans]